MAAAAKRAGEPARAAVEHCFHSFATVQSTLARKAAPASPAAWDGVECPYFVTFNKKAHDGSWELRGCIGCLSPRPLSQLGDYAKLAAFEDRRFDQISERELPDLQCCVSLLVDYEGPFAWNDFEIRKHGIIIAFSSGGRKYSATYLPEVAHEQGWDHRETIASLVRKAGFAGAVDKALLESITLTRYQSSKAKATYAEFQAAAGVR